MKIAPHLGVHLRLGLTALTLSACGDDGGSSQAPAAHAYDELASAVVRCADELNACSKNGGSGCAVQFETCGQTAGAEAEAALVDATSDCLEGSRTCEAKAGDRAAAQLECDQSLRACLGAASEPVRSAGTGTGASASTFQCFGQLRECIASEAAPVACSGRARACVLGAISKPDARPLPRAGRGGSNAGSAGEDTGAAGRSSTGRRGSRDAGVPDAATSDGGTGGRRGSRDDD